MGVVRKLVFDCEGTDECLMQVFLRDDAWIGKIRIRSLDGTLAEGNVPQQKLSVEELLSAESEEALKVAGEAWLDAQGLKRSETTRWVLTNRE
jgi:hypothetical protein